MSSTISRTERKKIAKELYLTGKKQQKEIAKLVSVSEQTISKWVKEEKWELLRANLTTTKESVLANWYAQLAELNNEITNREEGKRYPTASETDSMVKISTSIKKLETETGIADITSVCRGVCEFVRQYDVEDSKRISDIFDAYIEQKMK